MSEPSERRLQLLSGSGTPIPITALVVDDDASLLELARSILERDLGAAVTTARDAESALAAIQTHPPMIVLTDLNMPGLGGLELVEQMRKLNPDIPAVVMTAHGSEETAVEALRRGAASYVSKKLLHRDLAEIIHEVLSVRSEEYSYQKVHDCLHSAEYHWRLPNDRGLVRPIVSLLQKHLHRYRKLGADEIMRVGIALTEALVNAMVHGNLEVSSSLIGETSEPFNERIRKRMATEPYSRRVVHVDVFETPMEARYQIRDEGPGFDPAGIPDPTDPDNLEKGFGRGLLLIRTFMDEVFHNATGNQITLIKRATPI